LLERLTDAMNFTFSGHEVVDSHQVEIFEATPRPDYVPKALRPGADRAERKIVDR
jgi:hypothetical protein